MCGIVGIIGKNPVAGLLLDSLKRLEYRGYDSAGIATLDSDTGSGGTLVRRRAQGKLVNLEKVLQHEPVGGTIGIGHTRWATHGGPSETNAHPHMTARVAVVHNGIIENFSALKTELTREGYVFESQTDTEVVAHLVTFYLDQGLSPKAAVAATLKRLEGAFALVFLFAGRPDILIGARRGSPLAVGYGDGEMFLGSDALALAPLTQQITYLEEGDWAVVTSTGVEIFNSEDLPVQRPVQTTAISGAMTGKGGYRHFMLKEIYEQPQVIGDTLRSMFQPADKRVDLPVLPFDPAALSRLTIIACGTSYYAAMVAKYWIEKLARLPVEIDVASEFRYRTPPMPENGAALVISQSGETADTLAALRYCRAQKQHLMAIVNVAESTIARESDYVLQTKAGPEIGVASTKAFTTQLVVLACLAMTLAKERGHLDEEAEGRLGQAIAEVPSRAADVLAHDEHIHGIAKSIMEARDVLYLGRGTSYPIALEGALKLKEISYIHAEGYAAGEMKHGPIALIDEAVPIIVLAPDDDVYDKTLSNVQEAVARDGRVIFVSDKAGIERLSTPAIATVELPTVDPFVAPILYSLPVQLLAYHVAVLKGTDVDQPRNLAKSVTVE